MSKLSRAHNLFTGVEEERLHYVSVFDIFLLGKSARLSRSIHFEGFFSSIAILPSTPTHSLFIPNAYEVISSFIC